MLMACNNSEAADRNIIDRRLCPGRLGWGEYPVRLKPIGFHCLRNGSRQLSLMAW
jgi:hypothetical protein